MLLAFVLSAVLPVAAMATEIPEPLSVFQQACMNGSARFHADAIAQVPFDRLPGSVRDTIPANANSQSFRLLRSGDVAFLTTYGFEGEKICQVSARGIAIARAVRAVSGQSLDRPKNQSMSKLEIWSMTMPAGYRIDVWQTTPTIVVMRTRMTPKAERVR